MTRNPPALVKKGEEHLWDIAVLAAETQYAKKDASEFTAKDWARTVGLFKALRAQKRKNPENRYEIRHIHGEGRDWDRIYYFIHDWDDPHERNKEDIVFYTSLAAAEKALALVQEASLMHPQTAMLSQRKNPEDEEMEEPDEEDIFFSPAGPLGAHTSVSAGGKHIGTFKSDKDGDADEKAYAAAKKWAKKANFYPSAWQVSDHGNYHLISDFWKEGNPRAEVNHVKLPDAYVKLWKSVETSYHPGSKSSKIRGSVSYSVVTYTYDNEPIEERSVFGIKTLAEAKKEFKRLTDYHCGAVKNPKARRVGSIDIAKNDPRQREWYTSDGVDALLAEDEVKIYKEQNDWAEDLRRMTASEMQKYNRKPWQYYSKQKNPSDDEEVERVLLLDESRGIYIPKKFAQNFDMKKWHVDKEDEQILLSGPDGEHYWEAWDDVLAHAYIIEKGKKWTLEQDGDLFAVHYKE